MSLSLTELRSQLHEILHEHPDEFWTAYSIWTRLQDRFPEQAERLSEEYGDRAGRHAGSSYSPASYIGCRMIQVTST